MVADNQFFTLHMSAWFLVVYTIQEWEPKECIFPALFVYLLLWGGKDPSKHRDSLVYWTMSFQGVTLCCSMFPPIHSQQFVRMYCTNSVQWTSVILQHKVHDLADMLVTLITHTFWISHHLPTYPTMYSGTPLRLTPLGQSFIERCP